LALAKLLDEASQVVDLVSGGGQLVAVVAELGELRWFGLAVLAGPIGARPGRGGGPLAWSSPPSRAGDLNERTLPAPPGWKTVGDSSGWGSSGPWMCPATVGCARRRGLRCARRRRGLARPATRSRRPGPSPRALEAPA